MLQSLALDLQEQASRQEEHIVVGRVERGKDEHILPGKFHQKRIICIN
jgi:hypothetical protein